ncbi:MAG: membrane protein insertase YidC [Mycoplasmatales bacterium]|nr:membrane protein insertase YidC [Mycoplasmatales bacterium]
MSYGNRSKQYDWFKGKNDKENKTPKSRLKTIWRFTKIFLMFSLFFISMWGLVQSFVIVSNTTVGNGVEFYNSEEEIAPHVTRFSLTESPEGIYSFEKSKDVIWLHHEDKDRPGQLDDVNKQITNKDSANQIKMSDAFKGTNEAVSLKIIDKDGNTSDPLMFENNGKYSKSDSDKFLALSSQSEVYPTPSNTLKKIYVNNVEFKISSDLSSIPKEEARQKFSEDFLYKIDKNVLETLKKSDKYKSFFAGKTSLIGEKITPILKEDAAKLTEDEKLINSAYVIQQQVVKNAFSYLNVVSPNNYSILNFDFSKNPDTSIDKYKSGDIILNNSDNSWYKSNGTKWVKTDDIPSIKFNKNLLTGTKYVPIISWSQAWTRGFGPFYGIFVWPISKLSVTLTDGIPIMSGWETLIAIVMIVFILRIIAFGLTFKSVLQQTKQQEIQAKKAVIDAKYANYKGNKQMEQRKRQETAALYKKAGISPLGALGSAFIGMPIFLSVWRIIGGIPHIKATIWMGINFSATSYKELFAGEWQYLPLILLAGIGAAFQNIYPRLLTKRRDKNRTNVHQQAAMKKNNKTQNIMMGIFVFMAVIFSAGLQIYWIVGSIWQIIQVTITHNILVKHKKKSKKKKIRA